MDRVRHPNDRGGRDVCVSRLGLPILLVQAQPVRPSREEQTYQTLVSGQRPCEPKHPSPRLTAPGWYVLTVRTIRASFTRDRGLLGACETTSEKQALCEKSSFGFGGRLGYQPRGAALVTACIRACSRLTSGTAVVVCAHRPRMPSPALATRSSCGHKTCAAHRDGRCDARGR